MTKRPPLTARSSYTPPDEKPGKVEWEKNRLSIAHNRIQWKFGGDDNLLGDQIEMSILAIQEHRLLWSAKYNPKGGVNTVCCRSADSVHGFGLGRRPDPGEGWKAKVARHDCTTCETGHPPFGEDWLCKPDFECLVLFRHEPGGAFHFGVLDASGATAPRFPKVHRDVLVPYAEKSKLQLYEFGVLAKLEPNTRTNGCHPVFDENVFKYTAEEVDVIAELIPEANDFWRKNEERRWESMRFVGWDPESGIEPPSLADVTGDYSSEGEDTPSEEIPF